MSSMLPGDQNNQKKNKPEPFGEILRSMNEFFHEKPIKGFLQTIDEFFKSPFPNGTLPVETRQTADEFIITAQLPGIKREQIRLNILRNYITISVENNEIETAEDKYSQVFQQKISRQQLSRTISLPQPIIENKVKASYRDGLLQIHIPREKGKTITIED
ncbi:MAG: Hsp20/alpha crystallin family protein [Neobacillus sp.]|jgi:HSP20 family protein